MLVAEKYRLQRQIGWSDAAEVHAGPADATHGVPVAVKIRHGMGGVPRPDGNRDRFLRAVKEQQATVDAGCRQVAPIFETGLEGDHAFYVGPLYNRSLDSLIQGRVTLDHAALRRLAAGVLQALEELRDRHGRAHGNLKSTNIFLDGKSVPTATVVLGDLALREDAKSPADCYALGTVIFQLVRGRAIRNFDWPIEHGPDWEGLGAQADYWRGFCNVLMSPNLSAREDALATARQAFKNPNRVSVGDRGVPAGRRSAPSRGGLWALAAGLVVAMTLAAAVLLPAPGSALGRWVRGLPVVGSILRQMDGRGSEALPSPSPGSVASSTSLPGAGPVVDVERTPPPDVPPADPGASTSASVLAEATPPTVETTPTPAEPTPPPTPNPHDKWIGYTAVLQKLRDTVNAPNALDQTDALTAGLDRLRESVAYLPVKDDPTVTDFLRRLPAKIEATGDQPDLPANLWTKETATRQGDLQSVTYQWGRTGFRFVFNRVSPSGGSQAFYLSATTVPVQFGFVLARMAAAADGRGPLSGAASVKGPVAWDAPGGNYALRPSWMVLDNINAPFYANAGRPAADSPMNGLSALDAVRVARSAGCSLPTLAQWDAVLASSSGQQWTAQWQTAAKVRSPEWAAFARNLQAQRVTGAKLPNDQCFGDRNDLSAVTQTSSPNLFFEGVGTRTLAGYAHLIGNVGQYLVDDVRTPTKYYFAGGSTESAPATFQSLGTPPVVVSPFLSAADGGLRLAALAKGDGSEKNPAFDKLKSDLDTELARLEKL